MKVLIIGGAGFEGSHLVDTLLRNKYAVVTVDNLSKTTDLRNLQFALGHRTDRHKFYLADVNDESILDKIFELEEPDLIFNFIDIHKTPIVKLADKRKISRIIHVADCDNTTGLMYVKRSAQYTKFIDVICPMVFGPRQSLAEGKYGWIPNVCQSILQGKPTPKAKFDFRAEDWIYIGDLISALILIMESDAEDGFDVVTNQKATQKEIGDIMNEVATGAKANLAEHEPTEEEYGKSLRALGWAPSRDLKTWLEHTMAWYKMNTWAFRQVEND